MEKEIKGYSAIFDNQDGSFDYICSAKTEKECKEKLTKKVMTTKELVSILIMIHHTRFCNGKDD